MRQWKEKRKKVLVPGRIILVYNDKSINKAQTWQKISFGKMGRAIFHHSHDSIIILRPKKILSLFFLFENFPYGIFLLHRVVSTVVVVIWLLFWHLNTREGPGQSERKSAMRTTEDGLHGRRWSETKEEENERYVRDVIGIRETDKNHMKPLKKSFWLLRNNIRCSVETENCLRRICKALKLIRT